MKSRLSLRPDLADCVLEERILATVSQRFLPVAVTQMIVPIVLTTNGYSMINGSSSFASSFAPGAGSGPNSANNGMNIASGFYVTGFGLSVMLIGNSTGDPGLGPGGQAGASHGTNANQTGAASVGSGANEPGGVPIVPRNPSGQSIPLNPGSGFLYIVPSVGRGAAPAATRGVNPNEPFSPGTPVAPEAPLGPLVPLPSSPGDDSLPGLAHQGNLRSAAAGAADRNGPDVALDAVEVRPVVVHGRCAAGGAAAGE
jgi:hypothetical protein